MNKSSTIIESFLKLPEFLYSSKAKFEKPDFKEIVQNFSYFIISKTAFLNEHQKKIVMENIESSKIIIFDEILNSDDEVNENYLILCFEKTIMILEKSTALEYIMQNNFFSIPNLSFCFLKKSKSIFDGKVTDGFREIPINSIFLEEIESLNEGLWIYTTEKSMNYIWSLLIPSISAYLIKKSYLKQNKYRIERYILDSEKYIETGIMQEEILSEEEYVEMRRVGIGGSFSPLLIYHIKKGELYVIKKPYGNAEQDKLVRRENKNYMKIRHPFLPKYIGRVKDKNYNVIEFIEGTTLENIEKIGLTYEDKLKIIFELSLIFYYFHYNELIYRDLKPNNVMIDSNKNIVLIDFDRLIDNIENTHSIDANNKFIAPEVYATNQYSYESDIYSVGKMIEHILNGKKDVPFLNNIIQKCTNERASNRPSISEIINKFILLTQEKVKIERCVCNFKDHFTILGWISHKVSPGDKMSLFGLGLNYEIGEYIKCDINKAIHYYTLADIQNYNEAQYRLGLIFLKYKNITQGNYKSLYYFSKAAYNKHLYALVYVGYFNLKLDINKAIFCFSYAANQNIPIAQYYLGLIYLTDKYCLFDINKAIHYLSLAANRNIPIAQCYLGLIYSKEKYCLFDINKAIHYLSLAANRNYPEAQCYLGLIYSKKEYTIFDISKSIHYLSLAANQNYPEAQYYLGLIYSKKEYTIFDISKATHYLSLAANQNYPEAQYYLGLIYSKKEYTIFDISKATHYLSLAANQNYPEAQCYLGLIYSKKEYTIFDISKSIHYLSLAANQNYPEAQFNLGLIYLTDEYSFLDINKAIHYLSLVVYKRGDLRPGVLKRFASPLSRFSALDELRTDHHKYRSSMRSITVFSF
ncbi:hypothetical protein M9Y10_039856 [Tritrichomonas musculus]|uniref:Protein kinase domain-containing protein n=1 Tax=Tritrichomonas musculus TaxID=1915356 RepID=A0ABR2GQM1_9EUKA